MQSIKLYVNYKIICKLFLNINCSPEITRKSIRVAGPLQSRGTTNYRWDHNIWLQGPLFIFSLWRHTISDSQQSFNQSCSCKNQKQY